MKKALSFKFLNKNKHEKVGEEFDLFGYLWGYRPLRIAAVTALLSLAVPIVSAVSSDIAELYTVTVGNFLRMVTAKISGVFPFSLTETVVVFSLFTVLYIVARAIYESIKKVEYSQRFEIRAMRVLACFVLLGFAINNFSFASGNNRRPLEENMGLSRSSLTAQQLYECAEIAIDTANECISSGEIRRTPDGSSVLPYSYDELNEKLNMEFASYSEKYPFIGGFSSNVKRIALSDIMTHTHISGLYVSYTGEANINTNYPDYVVAFTYAHEMSHQRGIVREDEANFLAFTLLYESDDVYLRYCAAVQLLDYLFSELAAADTELYYQALMQCDRGIILEMNAFYNFFSPYRDSTASTVMGAVNDASIKLRGDSDGEKSYGLMIELAAAYLGIAQ